MFIISINRNLKYYGILSKASLRIANARTPSTGNALEIFTTGEKYYSSFYCDQVVIMSCCIDSVVRCIFVWDLWVNAKTEIVVTRTIHSWAPYTLRELLCMSKHIPRKIVVHPRIVYWNNGCICFGLGRWACMCWGGCVHVGISIQSNIQTVYTCNYTAGFSHTLYTYTVKYTYADLVKRWTVAKYGSWVPLVVLQVTHVTQTQSMDYKNEC